MIKYLLAGFFSAAAVKVLLAAFSLGDSRLAIAVLVPILEETAKTGSAILISAGIFYTHIVFGCLEFITDSLNRRGIWPGLVALALHSVLGYVSQWVFNLTGGFFYSVAAAVVIHAAWNFTVVQLLGPRYKE